VIVPVIIMQTRTYQGDAMMNGAGSSPPHLNKNYVLAPFHQLLSNCQTNVLLGLRLIEKVELFPPPTPEELQFFQLSFQTSGVGQLDTLDQTKGLFTRWLLTNGFEDIHSSMRVVMERLFVLKMVAVELEKEPDLLIPERELELGTTASKFDFPALLKRVNGLFPHPLNCAECLLSFNSARNCLVHTGGIVTERHCNTPAKDKLVVRGSRFRLFFKRGEIEVLAEIGKPSPENAALMLEAEDFVIEFAVGQPIQLSLKQFLDVLNTCIFLRADIDLKLGNAP
jgi:hypothetical protein